MQLILQAELDILRKNDAILLQAILDESFDTSHPDYDQKYALVILCRNFSVPVDLCLECLHVKHQEELTPNQGYCSDCKPPEPKIYVPPTNNIIEEPEDNPPPVNEIIELDDKFQFCQLQLQVQQQGQLIEQLQARIQILKTMNAAFLCFFQGEAQNA